MPVEISKVSKDSSALNIEWSDGEKSSFNYMWLRDNCPNAHDKNSRHRMFNILKVSQDINPKKYNVNKDGKLEKDGHTYIFSEGKLKEAKERNYKEEYKKYGSSKKAKKYRAELNKYNRQKGTYGNGDKKDASHKGGKIVGFEEQSKNRGRAEKSRLKKEGKLTEAETMKLSDVWKDYVKKYGKNKAAEKLMDILTMGAWASWDGDKIKRFKKEIIKKFMKNIQKNFR